MVRLNCLGMNRGSEDPTPQPRGGLSLLADPSAHQKAALCSNTRCCVSLWGRYWGLWYVLSSPGSGLAGVYLSSSVGPGCLVDLCPWILVLWDDTQESRQLL